MEDKTLKMSFDPHTIEHLGIKMYSILPNAIAELIANAYDAEADTVNIKLYNTDKNKKIIVTDNGLGMSFDEVNSNFLRIGRKRRDDDKGLSPNKMRKVTGRKGLGKLAFFGIGNTIRIITCKDGQCVKFTLNWQELIKTSEREYEPKFSLRNCNPKIKGTKIELDELKRKSDFDKDGLAVSLSKLFNFFDKTFKVYISYNNDTKILINNELKYKNISSQIIWKLPDDEINIPYLYSYNVSGKIFATEKPLKPGLRGITLFAHGRLVNAPEFFGVGESSHAYSYLTGWLNVDFVDDLEDDIISTDRQSLSWDIPIAAELRKNLQQLLSAIEKSWRNKRKIERQRRISDKLQIDIPCWYDKLPSDVRPSIESVVNTLVESSELSEDKQKEVINTIHTLIPEYAYYHWRHIHETVKDASFEDYKKNDFYRAVVETVKRYESAVQTKAGNQESGQSLMMKVFGNRNSILSVASKYKKADGSEFCDSTKENIEEGQKFLSSGIMTGARNPLAHEEIVHLKESGLFIEKDCLDILSVLSHLFRRLDNAEKR